MKILKALSLAALFSLFAHFSRAQYVQPERDDTVRIYAKTKFDSAEAINALAKGNATIKGVAYTKQKNSWGIKMAGRIYANKITVHLYPVTPYLLEYLDLKKKENYKKLKIVYMDPQAWYYHYEAITNSVGEFTFPNLKPGKYYLEGVLPWTQGASYDQYTGSGYGSYGSKADYYERKYYNISHYDKLDEFVEIKKDGEVVDIKLKP